MCVARLHTLGHSTRPLAQFLELLRLYGIKIVVDIRTVPRSRHNPQFDQAAFQASLEQAGVRYFHLKGLGGLRPRADISLNPGWRNASFRNYADYMQTSAFAAALEELLALMERGPCAVLCAEAVPWRCHRSLVADSLVFRGVEVLHILDGRHAPAHTLTPFARVDGLAITYPPEKPDAAGN